MVENKIINFFTNNFDAKISNEHDNETAKNSLTNLFPNIDCNYENNDLLNDKSYDFYAENQNSNENFQQHNRSLENFITSMNLDSNKINTDPFLLHYNESDKDTANDNDNDNDNSNMINDTDDDIITPPSPAPQNYSLNNFLEDIPNNSDSSNNVSKVDDVIKDICYTLKNTKKLPSSCDTKIEKSEVSSPIWIPRYSNIEKYDSPDTRTDNNVNCDEGNFIQSSFQILKSDIFEHCFGG